MKTAVKTLLLILTAAVIAMTLSRAPGRVALARAAAGPPPVVKQQWTVDGVRREALVYVPADAARASGPKTPVVFAFHGHGGSMAQAARSFDYHAQWPEAIVVYMQGLPTPGKLTDPEGRRAGWQSGPGDQNDRDLLFFDAVFASLKADYRVDTSRVFATGHSNGGSFTYLLWATRGPVFRAVAPSGAIAGSVGASLAPKPVLHVAGERDPLVKFAWQERTLGALKKLNGCDGAAGSPWAKKGTLTGTKYASKTGSTPLVTLIHPGGHRFPAEAPALVVRFFKECAAEK